MSIYNPISFLGTGWTHRRLIARLARRRIEARYRGAWLGAAWSVLRPLMILALYTFLFSVILKVRWSGAAGAGAHFSVVYYSGFLLFSFLSESLNQAPQLMQAHHLYLKQALFPTEVLAWVVLSSALFDFVVGLGLFVLLYVLTTGIPPLTSLLLPLVVAPIVLMALGLIWFIGSLGVFLKDLSEIVGVSTMALMIFSPIFYPPTLVPESLQPVYRLNPLVSAIEMLRHLLFSGSMPDWVGLTRLLALGWLIAWLGHMWFMKTKKGFADVL